MNSRGSSRLRPGARRPDVANLKDIQRRITSVKKTQQITRAMRMVAGAKLRRAQNAIESARPYAERMHATLAEVARAQKDAEHPLLEPREEIRNVEFVVGTAATPEEAVALMQQAGDQAPVLAINVCIGGLLRISPPILDSGRPLAVFSVPASGHDWLYPFRWQQEGKRVRGTDFSNAVIRIAQNNAIELGLTPKLFEQRSIYELTAEQDSAELVVCCEVLEHLEQPADALNILTSIVEKYAIFSVPREPLWSVLNMARGKYLSDLGNTPGHVQRWSKGEFIKLVSRYFEVREVRTPMPWTMLLAAPAKSLK